MASGGKDLRVEEAKEDPMEEIEMLVLKKFYEENRTFLKCKACHKTISSKDLKARLWNHLEKDHPSTYTEAKTDVTNKELSFVTDSLGATKLDESQNPESLGAAGSFSQSWQSVAVVPPETPDYMKAIFDTGFDEWSKITYCICVAGETILTETSEKGIDLNSVGSHAEVSLVAKLRKLQNTPTTIDILLGYSPCPSCCMMLIDYFEQFKIGRSRINIRFATIYYHKFEDKRAALRVLNKYAQISVLNKDIWESMMTRATVSLIPDERRDYEKQVDEELSRILKNEPVLHMLTPRKKPMQSEVRNKTYISPKALSSRYQKK